MITVEVDKIRNSRLRHTFEVTDGERIGKCYSYFDHFDIKWEDGTWLTTIELSLHGIRKTFKEFKETVK